MAWTTTTYPRCEFREYSTTAANDATYLYWCTATVNPPPMSRKKARKAFVAAEEAHQAAKEALAAAEREVWEQKAAMNTARARMDEAARILAADK